MELLNIKVNDDNVIYSRGKVLWWIQEIETSKKSIERIMAEHDHLKKLCRVWQDMHTVNYQAIKQSG